MIWLHPSVLNRCVCFVLFYFLWFVCVSVGRLAVCRIRDSESITCQVDGVNRASNDDTRSPGRTLHRDRESNYRIQCVWRMKCHAIYSAQCVNNDTCHRRLLIMRSCTFSHRHKTRMATFLFTFLFLFLHTNRRCKVAEMFLIKLLQFARGKEWNKKCIMSCCCGK